MDGRDKQLVVVVTRYWPTALSVVRSLGAAGFVVDLVASAHIEGAADIAGCSKYVRNYTETICWNVKRVDDPELLGELLKYRDIISEDEKKPVLFPTDDYTASFIDRNREVLEEIFYMPSAGGGEPGAIVALMNKDVQSRLASAAGLLCPKQWVISLEEENNIPENMIYPCYCKPIESFSGNKHEMKKCSDHLELADHLNKLRARNRYRNILVQEFLDIDEEISLCGVCTEDEVIIPAVIRKRQVAVHERGIAVTGALHSFDILKEYHESIIKFMMMLEYVGIFDMDFQCVGDKVYFGEVNLRSGGTNYSYTVGGVNLPGLAVKAILGEEIEEDEKNIKEFGRTFVYEKVLWDEYIQGHMSMAEVRDTIDKADYGLIDNDDDPEPVKLFDERIREEVAEKKEKDAEKKKETNKRFKPIRNRIDNLRRGYPQGNPFNSRKLSDKTRVMIVGRSYCTNLSIARSLGLAGYEAEILRIYTKDPESADIMDEMYPEAFSRYVKSFHAVYMKRKSHLISRALVRYRDPEKKMLLIPTEDVSAYIIDEYMEELSKYYYVPNVNHKQGEVIRLMSKSYQKELAAAAGLNVPAGVLIPIRRGAFEIPEGVSYPCFVKPDLSRRARGAKKIMTRCNDAEELRNALQQIAEYLIDVDIIAEDYTEIRRELSLLGLCYEGEVICPGLFEVVTGGHGSRTGVSVTGRSLPIETIRDIHDNITEFLRKTGYNGLFDIDLLEAADGKLFFIELNVRYGASGYVLTKAGVNLPGMLADRVTKGTPLDTSVSLEKPGQVFVSEKVLLEEYAESFISEREADEIMDSVDVHFIKDPSDPRPYRYFRKIFRSIRPHEQL